MSVTAEATAIRPFRIEVPDEPLAGRHAAKNVGGGDAAKLATYVVEKGKPLITLVE